jgi:predicted nucleotidyltransferase
VGEGRASAVPSVTLRVLDPEVQRFLDEWLERIQGAFAPETLMVFGSRVSGIADEWSDIDIVLVSDRFAGLRVLDRLRTFDALIDPHRHVDVLCLTPEEFARRSHGPTLVAEAVRTGVRII